MPDSDLADEARRLHTELDQVCSELDEMEHLLRESGHAVHAAGIIVAGSPAIRANGG